MIVPNVRLGTATVRDGIGARPALSYDTANLREEAVNRLLGMA